MSTQTQILEQNARFKQAYEKGEITQEQYNQAMAYQNQRLASTQASPIPPEPTRPVIQNNSGTWIRKDYNITNVQTTHDLNNPLNKRLVSFTVEPTNKTPQELYAEREFAPKGNASFFGPSLGFMVKGEFVEVDPRYLNASKSQQAREDRIIVQGVTKEQEKPRYERGLSPTENRALSGLSLATTTATGIAKPILGVISIAATGGAEIVKRSTTGKDLTVEEALSVASVSQIAGAGALKLAAPRAQRSINDSYMQSLREGRMWKPSASQKVMMAATGAKPNSLATEIVTAKSSPKEALSFKNMQENNLANDYFWGEKPSPKTAELWMRKPDSVNSRVLEWAQNQKVKSVYLEGSFQRQVYPTGTRLIGEFMEPQFEAPYNPQLGTPYIPNMPSPITARTPTFNILSYPVASQQPKIEPSIRYMVSTTPMQSVKTTQLQQQQLRQESSQTQIVNQLLGQTQLQEQQQNQIIIPTQTQRLTPTTLLIPKQTVTSTPRIPPILRSNYKPYYPSSSSDYSGASAIFSSIPRRSKKKRIKYPVASPMQFILGA